MPNAPLAPALPRRDFLALAATPLAAAPSPAAPPQIGILVNTTYTSGTLEQRLDEARAHGLDCVQLSLSCAGLPDLPEEVPTGLPARFLREAESRRLRFASLQGTFNMCHPDPAQRQSGLARLRILTRAFPRTPIHICTGTRNDKSMWRPHPDNTTSEAWRDMAACIREATQIAAQSGCVLAFEPEVNNIVNSAAKARRLLDEIASPYLKVTLDPANLFPAGALPRMKEILEEAFSLLGKDIALAHAKDLDHDGDAGHKAAGEGLLDYDLYLRLLRQYRFSGPLLLHGLSRAQVPACVAFLHGKLARA
ncbi:MAG: sugar phosphate isomerase/epimerase [Bryobacter sp.]|jgi:sugar phosphate isomerase/epimerase|nr:sugar phosphate isomerase/epimerase [Bryobacter sp. CoA8 C33]